MPDLLTAVINLFIGLPMVKELCKQIGYGALTITIRVHNGIPVTEEAGLTFKQQNKPHET